MLRERGIQDYIFEEIKRVGEINFEFADKKSAVNTVVGLAAKMQLFEAEEDIPNLLSHSYLTEEFDKETIKNLITYLCDPKNLNIYIRSQKFEGKLDKFDKWQKT